MGETGAGKSRQARPKPGGGTGKLGKLGQTGGQTGTASVNTMGRGHLSGPARHNGWQHSIKAGPGRQPRLVASWSAPFPARSLRATERGLGWDKNRPCRRPIPLPKPRHRILKFLTRAPSTKSPCLYHLTLPVRCYSGPVRAPAFRERQTGAPRPGYKSSPWPPSVSRSTDRVTQDNGIDPKPFWRLRAIPQEPHLIKPCPGRPSRPVVEGRFGKK